MSKNHKYYQRKPNEHGGGAKTNDNGLRFEDRTNLINTLDLHPDIEIVDGNKIYHCKRFQGYYTEKHKYYSEFLQPKLNFKDLHWNEFVSKKYLPDSVIVNENTKKVFIIEKKYQARSGSVDEKLQTCDFKKGVYSKMNDAVGYSTEYFYLLNSWYTHEQYNDVKEYIHAVGCKYFINHIDFEEFEFI